jgi:hypothetical protein
MAFCSNCGSRFDANDSFCGTCGTKKQISDSGQSFQSSEVVGKPKEKRRAIWLRVLISFWVIFNFAHANTLWTISQEPVDRFRSLCSSMNLQCAPGKSERLGEAAINFLIFNAFMFGVWYWKFRKKSNRKDDSSSLGN